MVLHEVEGSVLVPNIMQRHTQISPLIVIVAIISGSAIGGIPEALVSIPIAAALRVLVIELAAPAVRRQTGADNAPPGPERRGRFFRRRHG